MDKITILEASEILFFGKRDKEVKLSTVARHLWIQTPSLYHWFADKNTLLGEVIVYSAKKFIQALDEILEDSNPHEFVHWYLTFPSQNKNLFGIAFQKGYCEDLNLRVLIEKYRSLVNTKVNEYLGKYMQDETNIYLLKSLLEKLSAENCMTWYCLPKLAENIEELFFR